MINKKNSYILYLIFILVLFIFIVLYGDNLIKRPFNYFPDMHYSVATDSQEYDYLGGRSANLPFPEKSIPADYENQMEIFGDQPYHLQNIPSHLKRAGATLRSPLVTNELIESIKLGKEKFAIYCAPCHGLDGGQKKDAKTNQYKATGSVSKYWSAIPSLYGQGRYIPGLSRELYPIGSIYHIITVGVGSMKGYSSQLNTYDRWALAHYVKYLQSTKKYK